MLGETWFNKDDPYDLSISGFECDHVFACKSLGAKSGRFSGGVSVYFKSHLKKFISVAGKSEYGLIWIKIDKNILPFDEDAFMCYIYVREQKSLVLRNEEIDYFELLESDIAKFKSLGKIFVTGDFNSRTGQSADLSDHLTYDSYLHVGMNEDIRYSEIPLRMNRDLVLDNYGRRLLDMCKSTGLVIANGRLGADKDTGEFTCVTGRGRSVVDYFLLSFSDFDCVSHFNICDVDEHSDHSGLHICLKLNNTESIFCSTKTTSSPVRKLVWACENQDLFRNTLLNGIEKYNDLIFGLETDSSQVNEVIENFSTLIFEDAYQYFGKSAYIEHNQQKKENISNPWFDNTCKTAKQNFNRAKHEYSRCRIDANRINLTRCRSNLNKAKRRAKAVYKFEEGRRVKNLAKANPKQFWKEIKKFTKRKSKISENLTSDDFFKHFSNVFQTQSEENFDTGEAQNLMLDSPFTEQELKNVILSLKSNKSPGIDGLIGEIFKCSLDIMSPLLVKLFNVIFLQGIYPNTWSEGLITPIHKKSSLDDTNNYRGITLINVLSKIYSHILNNRLLKWASENGKIADCQFGFQKNKSTVDCIFIFHAIISRVLNNGDKLYCCFVDYQKAFDLVNRAFLWQKLIKDGCSKIMIKALQAMYTSIKSCVRYKNRCTKFFNIDSGVKQGDPLSPILFIFFINDILDSTYVDSDDILSINEINLFMLLYADDAVLFAKSPQTLQNMLNKLYEYSSTWDLKVNIEKTKIMIFEKGRKTDVEIYYNNSKLEVVECFKYLGIMFYKNGSWNRTQKCLSEYSSFALHNLNRLFQNITLSNQEKFKLFDCLVGSVLGYASEVWGFHGGPNVERIHTQFCRSLLGVKKSTNLSALYSELGRKPLIIFRKLRIIRYWMKILKTDNILLRNVYNLLLNDAANDITYNGTNWAYQVKGMLDSLGFSHVWDNQTHDEVPYQQIKQRLLDNANQNLLMSINTSTKLNSYCLFKLDTELEQYLNCVTQNKYKYALSRFRLSSHNLAIETGRYVGIPREERLCVFCNMKTIENEFHFLSVCPLYIDLRRKYLPAYYCRWPTMNKFKLLMQNKSRKLINNLSKFIYFAHKRRNTVV